MKQNVKENMLEWHYPLEADSVSEKPLQLEISPSVDQCAALARRLDVFKIHSLTAKMSVKRNSGNMVIYVFGEIFSKIEQKCIVSLAPVIEEIREPFEAWYADTAQTVSFTKAKRERLSEKEKGEQPILEENEDPEPILDGKIDLGELVVQYFSLSINPYPRTEQVIKSLTESDSVVIEAQEVYDNPFAALKEWRAKENKEDY